jgi:hypothetical protein
MLFETYLAFIVVGLRTKEQMVFVLPSSECNIQAVKKQEN